MLALVAALVGPFLVDWTAYRATIEANAEHFLGTDVRVLGSADVRLLPSPRIRLTDVRLGPADDPVMEAEEVTFDLDLTPLLKREFRVRELALAGPTFWLSIDEQGRPVRPDLAISRSFTSIFDVDSVRVDEVSVTNGRLVVEDAGTGRSAGVEDINVTGSARSLRGPFDLAGRIRTDGIGQTIQIATGRISDDGLMAFNATSQPDAQPVTVVVRGTANIGRQVPGVDGVIEVSGAAESASDADTPPRRWTVSGALTATPERATVKDLDVSFGIEEVSFDLAGTLDVPIREGGPFHAAFTTRQLDLDRIARMLAPGRDALADALPLSEAISALTALPREGVVELGVDSLVTRQALVRNVGLSARTDAGGWHIDRLDATLPGATSFRATGLVGTTSRPFFRGDVALRSEQPAALVRWWRNDSHGGLALRSTFAIDASVDTSEGEIDASEVSIRLGETNALGQMRWRPGGPGEPPSLDMRFDAPRVDVGEVADAVEAIGQAGDLSEAIARLETDLSLDLEVKSLTAEGIDGKGLASAMTYRGGTLAIDRLTVEDFGGARLSASGTIHDLLDAPDGAVTGTLSADRLDGIMAVLDRLAPDSVLAGRLAIAGPQLVPARFEFALDGAAGDEPQLALEFGGKAGPTQLDLSVRTAGTPGAWADLDYDGKVTLDTPDGATLLTQLGVVGAPVAAGEPATLRATATGRLSDGLRVAVDADIFATALKASGTVTRTDGAFVPDLLVEIDSGDVRPAMLAAGYVLPQIVGGLPISLSTRVGGSLAQPSFSGMHGSVAGIALTGSAALTGTGERPRITGDLSLSEVSLQFLSEMVLGSDAWSYRDGTATDPWPTHLFGDPNFAFADLDLKLKAERLWAGTVELRQARLGLATGPRSLAIDGLTGRLAGGTVSGDIAVERLDGSAQLTGSLAVANADLEELVWRRDGRPVATGMLDLKLDYQSAGHTIAGLVTGLTGGGKLSIGDGVLRFMNPDSFDLVIRAASAGMALDEDKVRTAFESHLDLGEIVFGKLEAGLLLTAGTLRVKDVAIEGNSATAFASAAIDLDDWRIDSDWTLRTHAGEHDVGGVRPQVGLTFSGPLDAPVRSLDVAPLTAFLNMMALERQVRELERVQADVAERQRRERELLKQLEGQDSQRPSDAGGERGRAPPQQTRVDGPQGDRPPDEVAPGADAAERDGSTDLAPGGPYEAAGDGEPASLSELIQRSEIARQQPLPPLAPPRMVAPPPGSLVQ